MNQEHYGKARPLRVVLAAATVLIVMVALLIGGIYLNGAKSARAASTDGCMVERYNETKPAKVTSLNCTSNDVQLAIYELVEGPAACIEGDTITVKLKGQFIATSAERWDVGVFVATDGGDPNTLGGSCYNDFLHPVSEDNLDLELLLGYGPFFNGEILEDPADLCGDIEQGQDAYLITEWIDIVCQDSDNNGVADVNSCTVWANSRSDGDKKPSCLSELDTTAETTAKCTCDSVEITGLEVPETGTIVVNKVLTPSDDSGKFNLQIDGTTAGTGGNVGDGGTTGPVVVTAGTTVTDPGDWHTVGEAAGTDTDLADYNRRISCVDEDGDSVDADPLSGTVNVFVEPEDAWVCTITNERRLGTLTLVKTVDNDNGGTLGVADFPLFMNKVPVTSGETVIFDAGTDVTASETQLFGYTAGDWGGDCAPDGTVTIEDGVDKTCTITNDDVAPTLTLVKYVTNDDGGTLGAADFPAFIDGNAVTWGEANTLLGNASYTASETEQYGYTASAWGGDCAADGTVSLDVGDNKTCTITNDDIAPTLTLVKTVVNDNGGTLGAADFPAFIDGNSVTWGEANTLLGNASYTASETEQYGYTASAWGGDCAADGTVSLGVGDNKTCTITNDDVAPTLTLVKTVVNDNGGTLTASAFPAFIDGNAVTWGVANTLLGNASYTASETEQYGYTASVWGGDCAADGTVSLDVGDNKTCTITNDDVAPTLTLVKTVTNDDGGTLTASAFPAFIDGSSVAWGVANTLVGNATYTASETEQYGYAAGDWGGDCAADGTVSLGVGDNKTCTITNDDVAPTLTLVKTVVNDNGGTLGAADFPAFIDGNSVTWGVANTLVGNASYTASETEQDGYTASVWSGDCSAGGTVFLGLGANKTCYITNDDDKEQPSGTTVQKWILHDTVTISGMRTGAKAAGYDAANVTFSLYEDSCNTGVLKGSDGPFEVLTDGDYSTSTGITVYEPGIYYWQVVFSGDQFNEGFTDCYEVTQILANDDSPTHNDMIPY